MPERVEIFKVSQVYDPLASSHIYIDEHGESRSVELHEVNTVAECGILYQCWHDRDEWTFIRRRYRAGSLHAEETEMRWMKVPITYDHDTVVELASSNQLLPGDV